MYADDYEHMADYINFYNEYSVEMDDWQKYLAVNLIVQGLEDLLEFTDDIVYTDILWLQAKEILIENDHIVS